jgi:FkbM family methyltransferase
VTLVDIGASRGIERRWSSFAEVLRVVGFEPNADEFSKLSQTDSHTWINAAVAGRTERRTLYLTKRYNNSSLLTPNVRAIERLEWGDDFAIIAEEQVDCITLAESLSATGISPDILKIDTQGTELEILRDAQGLLDAELVCVELEVMFEQLYEAQPLFGEVDTFLRAAGFYLHELGNILYVKPRGLQQFGGAKGRIIQADAVYFRVRPDLVRMADAKIAAAVMAYVAYGYPDAAIELLQDLSKTGRRVSPAIASALQQLRPASSRVRFLPGRDLLTRAAKQFWLRARPVKHYLWENQLGNRL